MELETSSPYLLVFRDCWGATRLKSSPREIGMVLSRWIEWHDSLETQGKIRFRSAIGSEIRRIQDPFDANWHQVETETADPIVGYLLIDAANFDDAAEIAAACPGLKHGFTVEICQPVARV